MEGHGYALTNQRGRCAPRSPNSAVRRSPHATALAPFLQTQSGSFTQGVGQQARCSRIPMSGAAGGDVPSHRSRRASLSCGITALPTLSWPFLLCLIEQVFLSPLVLFTLSFCLFLPLPALQASCLISFLSPLSHSCLLTDGRAHLIACLVLFHPVLSSEFPLSLLHLKVLSRD